MDDPKAVWDEVDRLPPRQRQVLSSGTRRTYVEDVGTTLAISASAARSHDTQAGPP